MKQILNAPTRDDYFILDIDSTLLTTFQRNQAVLNAFIKEFGERYPDDCKVLAGARCQLGDYGYKTSLKRLNFQCQDEQCLIDLDEYWRKNFFSNNFLHEDVPTTGAVEWTQQLKKQGVGFSYLTARHKPSMWEGTLSSMKNMGFPIDENILFLKEDLSNTDENYKSQKLAELSALYENKRLWFIDNEPVVLNKIAEDHPETRLIWFDMAHSGRMQPPESAFRIDTFIFVND